MMNNMNSSSQDANRSLATMTARKRGVLLLGLIKASSQEVNRRMATAKTRKRGLEKAPVIFLLGLIAIFSVIQDEMSSPMIYNNLLPLKGGEVADDQSVSIYIPPSLSAIQRRSMSIDLGDGNCEWTVPEHNVPENVNFHKTLIAGYPSGDKRMIFTQMEALTGWAAKDEWDFEFLGMSNHPFIKANYPHHEGIWGWEDAADQVVMMIRNIRRSMVEYHDILWDIGYAKTWEVATINMGQLYAVRPPIEDFFVWRDIRVIEECEWYGWFIDYWMEGGLIRDIFTHKITTQKHWNMLMQPTIYTLAELNYDTVVGKDTVVTPIYDTNCANGYISGGCEPVAVISAEKLRDYVEGPNETAAIARVLHNDERTGHYVIAEEAWDCIWEELIVKGRGLKTVYDRPHKEVEYSFSREMLEAMISQLNRLIDKYDGPEWNTKVTANRIVELLTEHRVLIQIELNEVITGSRQLSDRDFLGPKEREQRRELRIQQGESIEDQVDHSEHFRAVEHQLQENKIRDMRRMARREERLSDRMA